jgi:3-dehydroquinate synthase
MSEICVNLPINKYSIYIESIPKLDFSDKKIAIITNAKISGLHISYLMKQLTAKEIYIVTIQDGEKYKNQESVDSILEQLFNYKFNRNDIIIAFGGGVIGDITGYCASIYQRGIDFIQIPTTLLAQVDSSVGGKTGINNKFGKNLIGSFHQPKAVYIDTFFLTTLEKKEYSAGIAEIIKMAICFNKDFFNWLCENDLYDLSNISYAIQESVKIKSMVVVKDEKENSIRAKLNYGHTFGHIIENQTNYNTYLHGEAVSIGIVMANKLANKLELIDDKQCNIIEDLLKKYNLPTYYKIDNSETFYKKFFLDKKTKNSKITFILANNIGDSITKDDIQKNDVIDILNNYVD